MTVDEFADVHPTGIYFIFSAKAPSDHISHATAIIDGAVYDSWDSRVQYVREAYCISEDVVGLEESEASLDIDSGKAEIERRTNAYLATLNKKADYMTAMVREWRQYDSAPLTEFLVVEAHLDLEKVPENFRQDDNKVLVKVFAVKFSPRRSTDANIESNWKHLSIDLREWLYKIRKMISDEFKAEQIQPHAEFYGDRTLLVKLPDWVIPLTTHLRRDSWNGEGYLSMEIDALPDDPDISAENYVDFEAPNLRVLRQELELYRTKFWRYGKDYDVDDDGKIQNL